MKPTSFLYEEFQSVATLTLNRPDTLNALTFQVYAELTAALRALAERRHVRAVVITGRGRAFCTGGDVKEIIGELLSADAERLHRFTTLTCDLVRAMRALPRPIVASLNGPVAGAGAAIALAADFRLAAEEARIAFLFVKVGLAGADMGAAHLLPRLVGLGKATELLMTGDFITAEEALRIGLYNRVVPAGSLKAETSALVERLACGPADALAATKRALNDELHLDLESALRNEARVQAELMRGPDFREGWAAFTGKRPPRFQ
jgi:enoyl-CoA hydratase/carnithine racemase